MRGKTFLFIFTVLLLSSIQLQAENGDVRVLRILVPRSTSALPFLLMAEEDPMPGIDVRVETFISHAQALIKLLRGEAELLLSGTSQGWENYLSGGPLVMINTGVWGVSYLIGRDMGIRSFSDLKGKRLALPFPGSPLDFQTRYILQKNGIDSERDVRISYAPFGQTVPRLLKGQIDVAPLPEPLATRVLKNSGLKRLIDYKQAWAEVSGGDMLSPQVSLFYMGVGRAAADSIDEVDINRLVNHWRAASARVTENPQRAAPLLASVLEMPVEIIEEAIGNTLFYVPEINENRRRVQAYYSKVKEFMPYNRGNIEDSFFF
jgi:NitT/TauT family transport system substrate-binding protein